MYRQVMGVSPLWEMQYVYANLSLHPNDMSDKKSCHHALQETYTNTQIKLNKQT